MSPVDIFSLPIKMAVQNASFDNTYYYSKAAFGAIIDDTPRHIFGFGCSDSREMSENSARYECIEHYLGSVYAADLYGNDELSKTSDINGEVLNIQVRKRNLLAGCRLSNGQTLNATGLAIGRNSRDASEHASCEVVERHLSYIWWFKKKRLFFDIDVSENGNYTEVSLCRCFSHLVYSMFVLIDNELKTVSIGSCVKGDKSLSVFHAKCEAIMLDTSHKEMINNRVMNRRYENLRGCDVVSKILGRIELESLPTVMDCDSESILDDFIQGVKVSCLMVVDEFCLVRAHHDHAEDVTRGKIGAGGVALAPFL